MSGLSSLRSILFSWWIFGFFFCITISTDKKIKIFIASWERLLFWFWIEYAKNPTNKIQVPSSMFIIMFGVKYINKLGILNWDVSPILFQHLKQSSITFARDSIIHWLHWHKAKQCDMFQLHNHKQVPWQHQMMNWN